MNTGKGILGARRITLGFVGVTAWLQLLTVGALPKLHKVRSALLSSSRSHEKPGNMSTLGPLGSQGTEFEGAIVATFHFMASRSRGVRRRRVSSARGSLRTQFILGIWGLQFQAPLHRSDKLMALKEAFYRQSVASSATWSLRRVKLESTVKVPEDP